MKYIAALVVLLSQPAWAFDVTLIGRLEQGGIITGTAPVGASITYNGHTVPTNERGAFVFGIDRDAPPAAVLKVTYAKGAVETRELQISKRDWKIDRVDGVPQKLVTPDPETAAKIIAENKIMAEARNTLELTPFYETGFMRPVEGGRISGVFGSQRILNGTPGSPHSGLDFAGPIGTPIRAAADGVVTLQRPDMIMTGNTVVLNHGYGLETVYIHMSKILVTQGQRVKQGDVIGEIGMTGRANGPHLHFGVTWFNTRLDPETVLATLPPRAENARDSK